MSDVIFDPANLFVASVFFCVVMAMVVRVRVKPSEERDQQDFESRNQRIATVLARIGNWTSAAVNVVIGALIGVAVTGLVQLLVSGAWVAALIFVVLSAALLFVVSMHERLGRKLFPSGIRPAREPETVNNTPLVRRFSLPAGLVLGVVLAGLGLDGWLLGWL